MRFWQCILFAAAALAVALVPTSSQAQSGVVSAGFEIGTSGSSYASFGGTSFIKARGQTFTATVSGQLMSVALRAGLSQASDSTVRISVHALDENGLPEQPPLGSADFSADLLPIEPVEDVVVFDMQPTTAQLTAGVEYAITMVIDPIDPAPAPFYLNGRGRDSPDYEGGVGLQTFDGVVWERRPNGDHHFEVRVDDTVSHDHQSFGRTKAEF